ncbi:MAG: phosphoribosylformylglycinamidine synthase [Bifidobacterium scardovii]|uniref:phosphoribosylformylglycinamidine synthase n=2 Tax=Bifidobacterium scardovii TaxID=158787 RepID=UPI0006698B95|nr:phosphoribosylformylglycinamidine synthase [Bifidobacterium scardovii]MDU3736681.1 phosphoribosylformylglycinamidine synthase [Bifidobacterium scardovii]MDU5611710.1 phosphoribosylformylglycinamidine synthase [Bifidobacterium scardovii]MDU6282905.1 phosphoribosylformylglycinamidine synthase [Bifidobacterium scardovii]
MVFRVYVEKKPGFDVEAQQLAGELRTILGLTGLQGLRIVNRYDVEGISQELFDQTVPTVFSEPQVDNVAYDLPDFAGAKVFATEFLPGQFDQRADSAAECIQLISQGERPTVRSAKVYALEGDLTDADADTIKRYVINPVEAREASLETKETLKTQVPVPGKVETIAGFNEMDAEAGQSFIDERGLAMDLADLEFCQKYFSEEGREPTITEIKVIDTYWSDHCRHTTFGTELDEVDIDDAAVKAAFERYLELRHELGRDAKPVCLMDMGTIGAKWLKKNGVLTGLDESEEINACTVKVTVDVNGEDQDWLFLFKNETHNHPTEIEPFGGAATCIGGCIRDPLSGRSYVYQAMRVTGAADPTVPVSETLEGKLPQRKLVTTAAAGYSSYGNQIGLATGQVDEIYHPGYVAKRMEVGAVVAATPADHVRRETPAPGDKIILLGGRTGRDGIGGATGSSKAHNVESLELDGAEVQKGNAPVERKLQRLFRRGDACRLIKRCNDFGAGGVSVAVGELADGLFVDLNTVPKKYEGLDGTELAISESQERMAVDVAAEDVDEFLGYAREENLEATVIATVTEDPRMVMTWNGDKIVNLSREFLASNGASKHQTVHVEEQRPYETPWGEGTLAERMNKMVTDINVASNKGLSERFDSTIGAGTVLMPFGGRRQLTPNMAMVAKLPVFGETTTASAMAWGFNPYIMSKNQFTGAYLSVVESLAKLVAAGFEHEKAYLSFQEYFEKLRDEPERWGKPTAAVLGALMAQIDLGAGAIGGKDSMSGSFEDLDVPPTLISFAVAVGNMKRATSPEFKGAGHRVVRIAPRYLADGLTPDKDALLEAFSVVEELTDFHDALAVSTPGYGATAEALFKMTLGNRIGVTLNDDIAVDDLFTPTYGSFIVELADDAKIPAVSNLVEVGEIGVTTSAYVFKAAGETLDLAQVQEAWESGIESVFPYRSKGADKGKTVETIDFHAGKKTVYVGSPVAKPHVVIPVFPGNNCEYDSAAAFERAGADVSTLIVNNLTPAAVAESTQALVEEINKSQIVMIPGGFSGGDEPDGSAKFITAFFRAPAVTEAVRDLLKNRDGLMLGICNGFQALIKLGLVPYGDIVPMTDACPTLTFNTIGHHQSRLVRTRVASDLSPWLARTAVGDIHTVAVSHGEGRFVASDEVLAQLKANGQIATQYVDESGVPGMDLDVNPNGSLLAIEGITSPDGRVFGKMGHSERSGNGLYVNVPGDKYQPLFEAGVEYFAA